MSIKSASAFAAKSIPKLYLDDESADVHFTFPSDGETIKVPAHKAILAIENPVFRAMFYGPMKANELVEIVDASVSAFQEFLQFFYLAEVTLTMENVEEVARLADKYDMLESLSFCATFLKDRLTDDNMIWVYQLAITLNNKPLMEFCEERIKMFTKQVLKSDAFLNCERAVVANILKSESLNCKEVDLFIGCIEWAKSSCRAYGLDDSDPHNLKSQLGKCFYLIRFETMTLGEIGTIMASGLYRQLFSNDELADLICLRAYENFDSEAFEHTQRKKRLLAWNCNAILSCSPSTTEICLFQSHGSSWSTWFSVNASVLLGEIVYGGVFGSHCTFAFAFLPYIMSIREHNELTFAVADVSTMLYTETIDWTRGIDKLIRLPQPIEIQSNKMYEIRFDAHVISAGQYYFSSMQTKYKLNEEITIKFHRNPTDSLRSLRGLGLVSRLNFNCIC